MSSSSKKVMLYESSKNLPKEGWFQRCSICNDITANTMNVLSIYTLREKTTIDYVTYICLKCENKVRSTTEDNTIRIIKNKFFRTMNRTIITYLRLRSIYDYNVVDGESNTSYNHTQLTNSLRKYTTTYLPVEPNPPAPLDVSSNSSTNSTRESGDKSGVQI